MHLLLGWRGIARWAAFLAVFPLLGTGAAAQAWKDGLHAGFATGADVKNEDFAFGYQAACEFNDYASMEFAVTRQNDEIQDTIGVLTLPHEFNIGLELWALTLTGRLGFNPLERLRLYAGAGLGFYITQTDNEEIRVIAATRGSDEFPQAQLYNMDVDLENAFGWHAGAGLEVLLTDNWELFAELRYTALEFDADLEVTEQLRRDVFAAPEWETEIIPDTLDYDHMLVRAGVNYRF
ncbi:MAG: porin family protein [Kiritimatiellae bacterium]|nr:porin family protein [Kiritimatiellia bacterium]